MKIKWIVGLALALVFHVLFWGEKMGLNVLIYTVFLLGILARMFPESWRSQSVQRMALGTLVVAIAVVVGNSVLSKIIFVLSGISLVGMVHAPAHRLLGLGFVQTLNSAFSLPLKIGEGMTAQSLSPIPQSSLYYRLRVSIIPLALLFLFYFIYYQANPGFAGMSATFWGWVGRLFSWNISFEAILFFLFGLWIAFTLMVPTVKNKLLAWDRSRNLRLKRIRRKIRWPIQINALRKEHRIAVLTLALLNGLLLIVNLTDLNFVWLGLDAATLPHLKSFVHEGTWLLIGSILLAMTIVLFFFRRNLNFISNNEWLKTLTYAWLIQNAILCLSVGMRNIHYIDYHGLAYKRIGVFIFLMLVLFGLLSMYFKIARKKSLFYLLVRNSWAVYMLLVLFSLPNWDAMITRYNLTVETKSNIDVEFLLKTVSEKNLYILEIYKDDLFSYRSFPDINQTMIDSALKRKRQKYERMEQEHTWLSWNLADHRNEF